MTSKEDIQALISSTDNMINHQISLGWQTSTTAVLFPAPAKAAEQTKLSYPNSKALPLNKRGKIENKSNSNQRLERNGKETGFHLVFIFQSIIRHFNNKRVSFFSFWHANPKNNITI